MIFFPDTSFVCALYREQENSGVARRFYSKNPEPLWLSSAVEYEFRNSIQLHTFLHSKDKNHGFTEAEATRLLVALDKNIEIGAVRQIQCDWPLVFQTAQRLSSQHTRKHGYRAWDVLHVATAVHLQARVFLSFDFLQCRLARQEGLETPLAASIGTKFGRA